MPVFVSSVWLPTEVDYILSETHDLEETLSSMKLEMEQVSEAVEQAKYKNALDTEVIELNCTIEEQQQQSTTAINEAVFESRTQPFLYIRTELKYISECEFIALTHLSVDCHCYQPRIKFVLRKFALNCAVHKSIRCEHKQK